MDERKKENATTDNINNQADILTDLPVADGKAEETKGGTIGHVKVFDGRTGTLVRN